MSHELFEIPFREPVLVFSVVLVIILISPILFARLKIPGIVGLILFGVILGPHGFHVLERDSSIVLFGTVGLLYIMFLAGLEMDMHQFRVNRYKSIMFGVLTFVFPFLLGFVAAKYILHYSQIASVLLASMFSTHTLIAYPLVGRLGITQTRTMPVIVGGTILTDAAVLLILAIITNVQQSEVSTMFLFKLFALLGLMVFVVLWAVPKVARWFFRTLESDGHSQYIFVLSVVFLAGLFAHLIGVEPIIGAFLAGLALNQLIPNTSTLMNRIEFVGNSIFIPFFLINVGMLVDYRVLLKGPEALLIALLIVVVSFTGKWLAAFVTQKLFRYSRVERALIWGMSSAHAAATIAVVLIGFNLKLLDENVLNGTVLLILISCLGSSLITERAGRQIAIDDESNSGSSAEPEERILVPVANLANVDRLIDLSLMIKNPRSTSPIFPLYVLPNRHEAEEKMIKYKEKMFQALKDSAVQISKEPVFRVDVNVANGILLAVTELRISDIVMGWNGKVTYRNQLGPILDSIIDNTNAQILICKLLQPVNTIKRILAMVPEHAEREGGFPSWVDTLVQFSRVAGAQLHVYSTRKTVAAIYDLAPEIRDQIQFVQLEKQKDLFSLRQDIRDDDAIIVVLARKHAVSYNDQMEKVPSLLCKFFENKTSIILYPSQRIGQRPNSFTRLN